MINLADEAMTIKLDYDLPEYPKMDVVLYEGGLAEYKLANQEAALERWGRLAREFPTSLFLKKLPKAATAALKSPAPGAPIPAS